MIISLVAVGDSYRDKISLEKLTPYNVCLLSDIKNTDVFYSEKYDKERFSYFDKLYFSLDMVERFKEDVFYIDVTKLDEVNFDFPKDGPFYYKSHWPYGDYFDDYIKYDYFEPLIKYFSDNGVDYKSLPAIRETEIFFSKNLNVELIKNRLKEIQPIFREMSINKPVYSGYDNAEGIALSYVMKTLKLIK